MWVSMEEDGSSPDTLLTTDAFRRVIFGKGGDDEEKELLLIENSSPFSSKTFDVEAVFQGGWEFVRPVPIQQQSLSALCSGRSQACQTSMQLAPRHRQTQGIPSGYHVGEK